MLEKGVTDELNNVISELMNEPLFNDFLLGGGTNLAIKYNHRSSIDVDLFSEGIVGTKKLNEIIQYFENKHRKNVKFKGYNFESKQLAWLQVIILDPPLKLEFIQNIKLLKPPEINQDGIRLIQDIDIGALKLLAASDRGTQKDFYDLYLLSQLRPLSIYYDALIEREKIFCNKEDINIFTENNDTPLVKLTSDLTSLADFNKSADPKNPSNQVYLTIQSPVNFTWPVLRDKWKKKVELLAKEKQLKFKAPETKRSLRSPKERGFM